MGEEEYEDKFPKILKTGAKDAEEPSLLPKTNRQTDKQT